MLTQDVTPSNCRSENLNLELKFTIVLNLISNKTNKFIKNIFKCFYGINPIITYVFSKYSSSYILYICIIIFNI